MGDLDCGVKSVCTFGVLSLLLGCLGLLLRVGHFCRPCLYVFLSGLFCRDLDGFENGG